MTGLGLPAAAVGGGQTGQKFGHRRSLAVPGGENAAVSDDDDYGGCGEPFPVAWGDQLAAEGARGEL